MLVVLWIVSVKASEGVQGQTELPTCVLLLLSFPNSNSSTALRSVVPLSGLSMWAGQPRLLKMDTKMFDFLLLFFVFFFTALTLKTYQSY